MFRKADNKQKAIGEWRNQFCLLLSAFCLFSFSGCGPKYSYPADTVPKSIETICKKENKLDVTARVVGKTAGALLYMDGSLDPHLAMTKDVNDAMGKVMQAVTRVALSTDRPLDYCVVYIRDRVHGTELSLIRSLDDIRRAYADALGVEEAMRRTVINQGKFSALNSKAFVMRDITKEMFLAQQIAQRARYGFAKNQKDDEESQQLTILVEGAYRRVSGKRIFHFSIVSLKAEEPHETILAVFKSALETLNAYRYDDFNEIQVEDYLNRQKLTVTRAIFLDYKAKKITDEELLDRYVAETSYPQGGIRLFGFDLTQDSADAPQAPATASGGNVQ